MLSVHWARDGKVAHIERYFVGKGCLAHQDKLNTSGIKYLFLSTPTPLPGHTPIQKRNNRLGLLLLLVRHGSVRLTLLLASKETQDQQM